MKLDKPKVRNLIIFLVIYALGRLGGYYYYYEKTEVIKEEVAQYLQQKYQSEFQLDEPKRQGRTYHIHAKGIDDTDEWFLIIWEKRGEKIVLDSYYNTKWRGEAKADAVDYFKSIYGNDLYMFYNFHSFDKELLEYENVRSMNYKDVIEHDISKISIDAQLYLFVEEHFDRALEAEKAKAVIDGYFKQNAESWRLDIFYFSKNYFDEFVRNYNENELFMWLKDTKGHNKLYKSGQLLDLLPLTDWYPDHTESIRDKYFYGKK